jgi:ribosomal protein L44E
MSSKHVRTAADLVRFKLGLRIECLACGHANELAAMEAFGILGAIELRALEPRLKCSKCAAKRVRMTMLQPPSR